jgi:hypothetical protein
MGMARAATDNAICHHSMGDNFRNLIAKTPGSWSEIAEQIKDFMPEDAFTARRRIHETICERLNRVLGENKTQEVIAHVYEGYNLIDLLKLGQSWRRYPELEMPMVAEDREKGFAKIIRNNRQPPQKPGLIL